MLREIINTNSDNYILNLPEELKNRDIEIIAFPIDKIEQNKDTIRNKRMSGLGCMQGMIDMERFDEPLEEFEEYM